MLKSNLRSKTSKSFTQRPKIRNQNLKIDPPGYLPVASLRFRLSYAVGSREGFRKVKAAEGILILQRSCKSDLTVPSFDAKTKQ